MSKARQQQRRPASWAWSREWSKSKANRATRAHLARWIMPPGQPIILPAGGMFLRDRAAIAQALLEHRIPSIAAFRENMEAGALISYGFDLMGLFYDIASYVQRLAAGAKPSDMPIEQSPRFYMAINLKTAASLGVSLSDVFIARANEVRE